MAITVPSVAGSTSPGPGPGHFLARRGTALTGAQLDAKASVPGTFTYSPPAGTVLKIGTQTLRATFTPADATDYRGGTVSTQITVALQLPCNLPRRKGGWRALNPRATHENRHVMRRSSARFR